MRLLSSELFTSASDLMISQNDGLFVFKDPYLNNAEFQEAAVRDNIFNFRSLIYVNEDCTSLVYLKVRKLPINSTIVDLCYIVVNESLTIFRDKMIEIFLDVKSMFTNYNYVNISVLEKDLEKDKVLSEFLLSLEFKKNVIYYDEFGLGHNVVSLVKLI